MPHHSSSLKKVVETGIPKHIPPKGTPVLNTCTPTGVGEGAGKRGSGLFDDDACSNEDDDDDDIPRRRSLPPATLYAIPPVIHIFSGGCKQKVKIAFAKAEGAGSS